MAKSGQVELYTTDFALDASGASYKGLIVVNKVYLYFKSSSLESKTSNLSYPVNRDYCLCLVYHLQ